MAKPFGGDAFPTDADDYAADAGDYAAGPDSEENRISGTFISDNEMRALLSQPAPKAWVPNEGDAVAGTVTDRTVSDVGEYGEYPILEINTGKVSVVVHCYHETLQKEIERRNVQVGDLLAIRFNGQVESKVRGHNPYYAYRIIHRPALMISN